MVKSKITETEINRIILEVKHYLKEHNGFGELIVKLNDKKLKWIETKEIKK